MICNILRLIEEKDFHNPMVVSELSRFELQGYTKRTSRDFINTLNIDPFMKNIKPTIINAPYIFGVTGLTMSYPAIYFMGNKFIWKSQKSGEIL